jgi:predicted phage terminase large subunit-like protein
MEARRTMNPFEIQGRRGSLRSAGVGKAIAGLPADGAIIDDPFGKREEADSARLRERVWDWYANDKLGDYSAIVFLGLGQDGLLYVDAILDRIVLDQLVRKTVLFCDEKKPDLVGIEAEQFQELLVHEFRRQCGEKFTLRWPMFEMVSRCVSKTVRIRRLSQYAINRELRFKADSPGCRLLVDQLMDFPLGEHDDGPDALEMCTRLPLDARR